MTDYRKHPDYPKTFWKGMKALLSSFIWIPPAYFGYISFLIPCAIHFIIALIYDYYIRRKFVRDHQDWTNKKS